jgi:hypothetical protein
MCEHEIHKADVEDHFFGMHMTSLRKQGVVWKPFNWNLFTWAFYNVKNNQAIGLIQNLFMHCIICHNEMVGIEFLTLRTGYYKGLIAYYKSNGMIAM